MRSFRLLRRPATPTAFACWLCKKQPGFFNRTGEYFQGFQCGNFHFGSYISFA